MHAISVIALTCALVQWAGALPMHRMERMVISKMRMADLESSATGYAYNQQHGSPVSYVQYTDHGSGSYYATAPFTALNAATDGPVPVAQVIPKTVGQYGPSGVTYVNSESAIAPYVYYPTNAKGDVVNYGVGEVTSYSLPIAKVKPLAPYYAPGRVEITKYEEEEDEDEDDDSSSSEEDDDSSSSEDDDDDTDDGNDDKSFKSGGGSEDNIEEYSANGEKGQNGFKKHYGSEKGGEKKYDREHQEGHYNDESGRQKGHNDDAEEHSEHAAQEKSAKGSGYGHTSYHKKGEKTNGYHNVFHKDEYKKNTDFYDEEHKDGYFDKHSSLDKHHNTAAGGFQKGGHHVSGHNQHDTGKKGHYDKGHVKSSDVGQEDEEAAHAYHRDHIDYEKESNGSGDKKHGYSTGYDYH